MHCTFTGYCFSSGTLPDPADLESLSHITSTCTVTDLRSYETGYCPGVCEYEGHALIRVKIPNKQLPLSECQKGRVVKTTYQHFPLDGRPCQNARWVVLTPCENSLFMSECIVALYRNGTLSALDGYIVTLEITAYAQHWHSDPERSTLDTDICSKWSCGILTLNGTFSTRACGDLQTGMF